MAWDPPTRRHRSKSAPRGKSPDPKILKKAAKESKATGLVTPPPKAKADASSSSSRKSTKRVLFGATTVTPIMAENAPGDHKPGEEALDKDKIIEKLKKELYPFPLWFQGELFLVGYGKSCYGVKPSKGHSDPGLQVFTTNILDHTTFDHAGAATSQEE